MKQYKDMTAKEREKEINSKLKNSFSGLSLKEEVLIISCFMDYLCYYLANKEKIDDRMNEMYKDTTNNEIVNYFISNIQKPKIVEDMLDDISNIADLHQYLNEFREGLDLLLKGNIPRVPVIDIKNEYNKEISLKRMDILLDLYKLLPEVKDINKYLKDKEITPENITDDFIKRIIKKIENSI